MILAAPTYRLTVADYHRMGEAGIFAPDARVELLDGQIVEMLPIGPFHSGVGTQLQTLFAKAGSDRWLVRSQYPIRLDDGSEPQPDLALVKTREDFYRHHHPEPSDVFLLVEVADSSVLYDRQDKLPVYARAGIAEYWLVNLVEKVVEVYRAPSALGVYNSATRLQAGAKIAPAAFPDAEIAVAELF